jgi:hypothetical protein
VRSPCTSPSGPHRRQPGGAGSSGLTNLEELIKHPADDLLPTTAHIGPFELFEIVCRLNEVGYSLPRVAGDRVRVPDARDREGFRLRVVEGLPLHEIALQIGVTQKRVRQILRVHLGLRGQPPTMLAARRQRPI